MMIKELVKKELLSPIAETLGQPFSDFEVEGTQNQSFGDFALNVALKAAKILKQSPMEVAKRIEAAISSKSQIFEKVEATAPGFVNLTIKKEYLLPEIERILERGDSYGAGKTLADQEIMIEFAHPNTHKQFHIGHLRNISLGESLVRLHEALGAKVIRANYQGDVGLHVAKALWGILRNSKFNPPAGGQNSKLEEWPLLERVEFLGQAYVEGNRAYEGEHKDEVVEINKKIYLKDPSVFDLWRKTRGWSLEYFDALYERLGSRFDRFYFESEVADSGRQIARRALEKGILRESEGAVIFDGSLYGLDKRVFLTAAGLPTYEAKELGLADLEFSQFGQINRCVHVVGPEQRSFFEVTFKVEELLDREKYAGKQYHFVYGYVQLREGKMSSRKGNVVTAASVIEAARQDVKAFIKQEGMSAKEAEDIAEKVAVGAVKYSMLKTAAAKDIAFDLKESVALEGNSGPYLQYTYARARSVLRKSQNSDLRDQSQTENLEPSSHYRVLNSKLGSEFSALISELGQEELSLLRTIYKFPEVVETAALSCQPHLICNFLFDLAQKFNLFYNNVPILNTQKTRRIGESESSDSRNTQNVRQSEESNSLNPRSADDPSILSNSESSEKITYFRLALTGACAQILKNGLYLLGIQSLERM